MYTPIHLSIVCLFFSVLHTLIKVRWFVFTPEIPIWVDFGGIFFGIFYYHLEYLRPFGKFYGNLVQ
jgi:hypothetical protein